MSFFKSPTPSQSLGFSLWKVSHLWQREINKILKKFDLTHMQFVVLASTYWLGTQQDEVVQVDIANLTEIDKMMTSNVVRKLVEKGLLIRQEHETDTRAKSVKLTQQGLHILKPATRAVENYDEQFFSQVQASDFGESLSLLLNSET